jgi:AhpD family alkylhydroperoxidase
VPAPITPGNRHRDSRALSGSPLLTRIKPRGRARRIVSFVRNPICAGRPVRVIDKPLSDYPWYLRPFFWNQRRKYGQVLKPALLWARSPPLFLGVALLYGVLDRRGSPLDPVLRSLVTVRVSQLNWCRFCVDLNSMTLARRAGSMEKVQQLANWRQSDAFTDPERAALDYAESMTLSDRPVTDDLVARLRRHFDDDAVVELTGLVAFQNLSSKFNAALDVPSQGFCQLPAAGAAPSRSDARTNP